MAHHALRKVTQYLVGDGAGPAGVIDGGDALVAAASDQHDLVANLDARDVADINEGEVHRNTSGERSALPAQQHIAAGREPAVEAVAIAGGDDRDARGRLGDVGPVVAERLSGGNVAQRD